MAKKIVVPRLEEPPPDPRGCLPNAEHKANFFRLIGYDSSDYPRQQAFHDACNQFRFVSWFAAARTGKSIAGAMELAYRLTIPYRRIWIVAPNYDLGSKEFEYIWKVFQEKLPSLGHKLNFAPGTVYNPGRGAYELHLGAPFHSWLKVRTAENLESLLGEKVHDLLMAEAPKMAGVAWRKMLRFRLVTYRGNAILPATPDGFNWAHDDFFVPAGGPEQVGYERSGEAHQGDYWTQISSADECPDRHYPKEEKDELNRRLALNPSDADVLEQGKGLFTHRSGLVLYQLKRQRNIVPVEEACRRFGFTHMTDPVTGKAWALPPMQWPRIVCMDYADAGWKATMIYAEDPWKRFAVGYWTWKEAGLEIQAQVNAAKDHLGFRAASPNTTWIVDKSAPLIEYQLRGAPVIPSLSGPGKKAWLISEFNGLCADQKLFFVEEPCAPFLYEAARFVRKPESDRPDSDERKPGSVVKKDDHLCDCGLYGAGFLSLRLDGHAPPPIPEKMPWPPPMPSAKDFSDTARAGLEGVDALLRQLNGGL